MVSGIEKHRAEELAGEELILLEKQREEERASQRKKEEAQEKQRQAEEQRRIYREELRLERERERERREEDRRLLQQQQQQDTPMGTDIDENAALYIDGLKCYPPNVLTASDPSLNATDKINLPQSVFEAAVQKKLAFPLNFRIEKAGDTSGIISHCGVSLFTAPEGTCYVPLPIMEKLGVTEGQYVALKTVKLPKGIHAQLQPHSAAWVDISTSVRRAILEEQLAKNYQTLTVHDVISFRHRHHNFLFNVVSVTPPGPVNADGGIPHGEGQESENFMETEAADSNANNLSDSDYAMQLDRELNGRRAVNPAAPPTSMSTTGSVEQKSNSGDVVQLASSMSAISILDADLSVDIIEPLEAVVYIKNVSLGNGDLVVEEQGELLEGSYAYLALKVADMPNNTPITVKVRSEDGDPDLYISHSDEIRRPNPFSFTWKTQGADGQDSITISGQDSRLADARASGGCLYIAIHAYKCNSDRPLHWNLKASGQLEAEGYKLGREMEQIADTKRCPSCLQFIPTNSFLLHEMRCKIQNWRCDICGQVMSLPEKEKHEAQAHIQAACACGLRFESAEMQLHQQYECPLRLVECLYCDLQVPLNKKGEHQGICGNRTVTCTVCHKLIKRNTIKRHVAETHGILSEHRYAQDYFY